MTTSTSVRADEEVREQEVTILRKYGLRWSVLAAWRDALVQRHVPTPVGLDRSLEMARVKLASGCFSVCTVGCDLGEIESQLTAADASSGHNWVDFWVGLLGYSMGGEGEVSRILSVPTVRVRFDSCGVRGCKCVS